MKIYLRFRGNFLRFHNTAVGPVLRRLHCKNVRAFAEILWRFLRILTEPARHAFVSVSRRNNAARYSVDLRIQTYTEQIPLKYGKLVKIRGYAEILYSVSLAADSESSKVVN